MSYSPDTEHTVRQPMDCSTQQDHAGDAARTAATLGAEVPSAASAASAGEAHACGGCPTLSSLQHVLTDVLMSCACGDAGAALQADAAIPRQTAYGESACERCGRQLARIKHTRPHGPGKACHPRCKLFKHPITDTPASADVASSPSAKKQRRTYSDPGEPASLTRKRTRAQPPATMPAAKKARVHVPAVDPSLLLDLAHAARLALLAAEMTGAQPVKVKHPHRHTSRRVGRGRPSRTWCTLAAQEWRSPRLPSCHTRTIQPGA